MALRFRAAARFAVGGIDRFSSTTFSKLQGSFDTGEPLPFGHASLFLRPAAGLRLGR